MSGTAFSTDVAWRARRACGNQLPDGYLLYQQKNGTWVGKSANKDCIVKSTDKRVVEDVLFLNALGRQS